MEAAGARVLFRSVKWALFVCKKKKKIAVLSVLLKQLQFIGITFAFGWLHKRWTGYTAFVRVVVSAEQRRYCFMAGLCAYLLATCHTGL